VSECHSDFDAIGWAGGHDRSAVLLTVTEVADRLRVSCTCVYQLVKRGRLACHRIGLGRGAIRISVDDLLAYVEQCRVSRGAEVTSSALAGRRLKHLRVWAESIH